MKIYAVMLAATWLVIFVFCLLAKFGLRYAALFATIQTAAGTPWSPLVLLGLPICLVLAYFKIMKQDAAKLYHWPQWAWLWDNADDGVHPGWYASQFPNWGSWIVTFDWTAVRNSVANLRHVRFVSGPGRPLLYHWWVSNPETADPKSGHYVKIGWESGPPYYPVFQPFGAGRGY